MSISARYTTNHLTIDKEVAGNNPQRVSLMFQAVDKAPIAVYAEGAIQSSAVVLLTPYSSFSYNTNDFKYFGRWLIVNDTDAAGSGSVSSIKIIETSQ